MRVNGLITRVICLLVAVTLLAPTLVFAADASEPWDATYDHGGLVIQFQPIDSYVCEQNPPNFKWGYVKDATSYELIVAKDPELKEVVFQKAGIDVPFANPGETLEAGIPLYWAVRYKNAKGTSNWSTVRKFRIDPDAYVYKHPTMEDMIKNIPNAHPRAYLNPDELEEFRDLKNQNLNAQKSYDYYMKVAGDYLKTRIIDKEPPALTRHDFNNDTEYRQFYNTIEDQCNSNIYKAIVEGYAYLLSGNKDYGRYAVDLLMEYTTWDAINGLSSDTSQYQVNRKIMVYSALVYDWCYDLMTEEERKAIREMIFIREGEIRYMIDTVNHTPYQSHGWTNMSMLGVVYYIMVHDEPTAAELLRKTLNAYNVLYPVWSYQDGGWSQGTDYAKYGRERFLHLGRVLINSGINLFDTAWMRNSYLFHVYTAPVDSVGSFGDGSGMGLESNSFIRVEYAEQLEFMPGDKNNGVRKWLMEKAGGLNTSNCSGYYTAQTYDATEGVAPSNYQLSHEFVDIGWINMTNDLTDTNRILLSFKSSPYGSYNHSHADQNAITIECFGQSVLANSGYYESYGTDHHFKIHQATAAHNSITVDTKGQKLQDIQAKGKLTGYLTQVDFDLAMGDATQAYMGALGKFERAIIYVRPDVFVVVDDLEATENKKSEFEFWLNTPQKAEAYEEGNGARLTREGAVIDATVQYPTKVDTYYNNIHAGSDMKEIKPTVKHTDSNIQKRIWFETEPVNKTKMIVTLDPHSSDDNAEYIDTEYFDEYVKMTFDDGSKVIVNITEDNRTITTKDGFTFDGLALAYNDESIMLVRGTTLKQGDIDLITLEKTGSVVMGENEVSISTYEDNRISINTDNRYISGVERVTDYNGREATDAIGITWEKAQLVKTTNEEGTVYEAVPSDDYVTFTAWQDNYQLMLNGKLITTDKVVGETVLVIDGVETSIPMEGATLRNGTVSCVAIKDIEPKKYEIVDKSEDLTVNLPAVGSITNVSTLRLSASTLEPQRLELKTVPITDVMSERIVDADAYDKAGVTVFREAEDYYEPNSVGVNVYTTRSYLSGGAGVSKLNTEGMKACYIMDVPEDGEYYFVVKYVTTDAYADSKRAFTIDGKNYVINLPATPGYGINSDDWDVAQATVPISLKAGQYELVVEPLLKEWNYDWLGLVKK